MLAALLAGGLANDAAAAPPPATQAGPAGRGQLVKLPDGRRINLVCRGRGSPTVVLESGFGGSSTGWAKVQPVLAQTTRVCAYDRAGYGFSDPGPLPRDGAAIARDLDQTLKSARIRGPYILVGHSAGGLYTRLFAGRRLREVAGMVFVDSSVEYQDQRMATYFGPGAGSVEGVRRKLLRCLAAATEGRLSVGSEDYVACVPKKSGAQAQAIALRPATWRMQLSEIETLFADTSDQVSRVNGILKNLPAIVLTASPTGSEALAEDPGAAAWQGLHRELGQRFRKGEQRIVKSGHLMMIERPEVVTGAVLELVAMARSGDGALKPHTEGEPDRP